MLRPSPARCQPYYTCNADFSDIIFYRSGCYPNLKEIYCHDGFCRGPGLAWGIPALPPHKHSFARQYLYIKLIQSLDNKRRPYYNCVIHYEICALFEFKPMNVRSLCLGILSFSDMTGYDIRKMASEGHFSHFCEASYGSIYPALSQLLQEGLVSLFEEAVPGKPARKIYTITDKGQAALMHILFEEPGPDRCKSEFLFYSLFADKLPRSHFRTLLVKKIAETRDKLDGLKDSMGHCQHGPSHFAIGYGVALNEAVLAYLTDHLAKLDGGGDTQPADGKITPFLTTANSGGGA